MAGIRGYWTLAAAAIAFRLLLLVCFPKDLHLGSRPEIATPLTSLRRLAEGYWLKQASMSPYSGSMYHGSPLLLSFLGPMTIKRVEGRPPHFYCSLMFVILDFITAMLIRATGKKLMLSCHKSLQDLNLLKLVEASGVVDSGDFASLVYLWNPFTILTCMGSSTSPIDNLVVIMAIYGACSRIPSLTAFGWVLATHLSLYPVILVVPIILLLGYGLDSPPSKLFLVKNSSASSSGSGASKLTKNSVQNFSLTKVLHFMLWVSVWSGYVLLLSSISLKEFGGLSEMIKKYDRPTTSYIYFLHHLLTLDWVMQSFFSVLFTKFSNLPLINLLLMVNICIDFFIIC